MAVTRKLLKALGIEDEKADQILEAHTETVNEIREERDRYKAEAEQLPGVQQELNSLREAAEQNANNPYKAQYEAVKKQFDDYKADVAAQQAKASKQTAYRKLLKEQGISDKFIDPIMKITSVDDLELNDKGQFTNEEDLKKNIQTEYEGFTVKEEIHGAQSYNPPGTGGGAAGGGATKSRAAILAEQYSASLYGSAPKEGK
jgi:transcription-repair coupling factor (superfamily II helicase)